MLSMMARLHGSRAFLRPRSLDQAALAGPVAALYKADRRSTVWSVYRGEGLFVVKRFEYSPLRQAAGLGCRLHPAQLERRSHVRLRDAGLPVVPLVDGGMVVAGVGLKVWLATQWAGRMLNAVLTDPAVSDAEKRAAIDEAASLTRRLIEARLVFRDLKPSNMLIDASGHARLIDTGSVRRGASSRRIERMIATMQRVLARNGAAPSLIERYASHLRPIGV